MEVDTNARELLTCGCSICRRKNALMLKIHQSALRILSGENSLTTYQFHTETAEYYFCKVYGIYPFHEKRVTPNYYSVNVFCLEEIDLEGIPIRATIGAEMP